MSHVSGVDTHTKTCTLVYLSAARTRLSSGRATSGNGCRWSLYEHQVASVLPIEISTGRRTTFNRTRRNLPKAYWLDATCGGESTLEHLLTRRVRPLMIRATGHGTRQICRMDRFGFPQVVANGSPVVCDSKTGNMVRALVTTGTKAGHYVERVAMRASISFSITTPHGVIQGLNYRFFGAIHHVDGYHYLQEDGASSLL